MEECIREKKKEKNWEGRKGEKKKKRKRKGTTGKKRK